MIVHGAPVSDAAGLMGSAVRALVLYALAEHQSGHATTIRVVASDRAFSVCDDGRGHAIERSIAGAPYLKFVYEHLDYPFEPNQTAPVQLQGIGMSLINALCSELSVIVRKPSVTLSVSFRDGRFHGSETADVESKETGNTVAGTIRGTFQDDGAALAQLRHWLVGILTAHPSLKLVFNEEELQLRQQRDVQGPRSEPATPR